MKTASVTDQFRSCPATAQLTEHSWCAEANTGAASAFSALQTECTGFEGPGNTYYDALCSVGTVDAQLMSSIYQCADTDTEGYASFNIHGAPTIGTMAGGLQIHVP